VVAYKSTASRFLIALVSLIFAAGCATVQPVPQKAISLRVSALSSNVDVEFAKALAQCQTVLTGFERRARDAQKTGAWIQSLGGLAGALAPIAALASRSASVVAGLGAAAGYANTEIAVIEQNGLDQTTYLMDRARLKSSMDAGLTDYYAARQAMPMDRSKVLVAIDKIRVACIAYAITDPNSLPIDVTDAP
jgi:hypothetical protein